MLGGYKLMNKFLRVLGLGLMVMTFAFAGFAQGERTQEVVYKEFTDNFESTETAKMQIALNAAKEFIAKFNTADYQAQIDYLKDTAIPYLEKALETNKMGELAKIESDKWYALLGNIEKANKAKNWAEVMSYGKQALNTQFQHLDKGYLETNKVKEQKFDIGIILGVMGFDRAAEKNDTFNNDALTYLKQAIQQIESGQTSKTYGLLGYELKDKENALGLLNYYIGYINYYRQNKKTDAMPYLFKATQHNSASKNFPSIYQLIGQKFYDQLAEMDKIRVEKTAALEKEQNEEAKIALAKEIKAIYAEEKGVAERGIEAYAKALKASEMPESKVSKEYKDGIRSNLEDLYKFRFNNKTDGIDTYINTVASKPLTNPATPVQPVVEEETTETTGSTTSTTTSTTPSTRSSTTKTAPMANGTNTTVKSATTKTTTAKKPRKR